MRTVRGRWVWAVAGLLLVLAGILIIFRLHRPKPPFELSFWYWHSPFELSLTQQSDLKQLGVSKLFVRAGTFSSDGRNVVLVIPQRYGTGGQGFQIHQVFNFDAGVIRHFETYDLARMAGQVATRVTAQVRRGRAAGLDVRGIQFDFDCPTRLLPRYAELVRLVRPQLPPRLAFSATALMSWLGTRGVLDLSKQVDFLAPQAYEGETGRTADAMRPVSDEQDFRRRIGRADSLACPFYVGIPAYGHAFLFDPHGQLSDIYRGLEPFEALRHPSFNFVDAYPADRLGGHANAPQNWVGEEILKFRAVRPALNGQGLGDTLGFTVPTPAVLQSMLSAARETQSTNCLGAIIYRMPEEGSAMTLSWPSLVAALQGRSIPPTLKIALESQADTFDLIESEKPPADAPKDLNLQVDNAGGPTFLSPDAVEIEVQVEHPGFDEVEPRDMDSASLGLLENGRAEGAPPARANLVTFTRSFLSAGQKLSIGPIRLLSSKPQHITIRWKVRGADGFEERSGQIALTQ